MTKSRIQLSTGLPKLDRVFRGLMQGDNIVWQVDSIEDYRPFVEPYLAYARESRQKLVYFRFAEHPPLLPQCEGMEVCRLEPQQGFEPFIAEIHRVINEVGRGGLFLFDCLSELAADWNSDRMLGNFFMLTCPHLYDRAAIAYFAILRNYHSFHAVKPISNTTQILIDAFHRHDRLYIHPIKVQHRHSATMYMLHVQEGDDFVPVTQSCVITETLADTPWSRQDAANYLRGFWSKTFAEAESLLQREQAGEDCAELIQKNFRRILRMLISRDEPVLRLAAEYFTLHNLLDIRRRMIGSGLIGGKSVGMLLARAILEKSAPRWREILEVHDSFYVGADVFYTYLVQNGCWWQMQKHKTGAPADEDESETARRRILAGVFPDYIVAQFADMLDYYGQSPIIVRSSSLMEDNFGNAFAGKYESVFCANQGGPHKRLDDFLCAVRTVYASTLSPEALAYRARRGLLNQDEQMGLLIQRVSGATYGNLFFPQAAGVGFSFNPYVWHENIEPEAGMLRLVFGVGTRAVDRSDDDYTRVVALNDPMRRLEANFSEVRQYAQRRVDVLDLEANQLTSTSFEEIVGRKPDLPLGMFASQDEELRRRMSGRPLNESLLWVLTFEKLLSETRFVEDMRGMLKTLAAAYSYPVDTEFTLNFFSPTEYKINVVQCRPLQVKGAGSITAPPQAIPARSLVLESRGPVIGESVQTAVDWVIYVVPSVYGEFPDNARYTVANIIGELTHRDEVRDRTILLIGPGRWGTTTPSLGVPVTFAQINSVSVVCELVTMRKDLVPDVSLGTHFFNELVENDMLYLALYPDRQGYRLRQNLLERPELNRLAELLPEHAEMAGAVRVLRTSDIAPPGGKFLLYANALTQRVLCYLQHAEE